MLPAVGAGANSGAMWDTAASLHRGQDRARGGSALLKRSHGFMG